MKSYYSHLQSEKSEAEFEFTTYLQILLILLKLKGNFSFFLFFFLISSPVTEDVSQTHALIIIIIIVTSKLQSNIHFLRLNARLNEHLSKFLWHHDQITYNPGHTCTL